jgi:hypothetical protein
MAALVGLAYRHGDVARAWAELVERFSADAYDASALMDMSMMLQTSGQREKGLELQHMAVLLRRCFHRVHGAGTGLNVLVFVAEGDFMANTPIDFLMEGSNAVLSFYYVDERTRSLLDTPEHDVAFVAVGESEENQPILKNLRGLLKNWPRPIMNGACDRIAALTRDRVAALFAGETAIVAPATVPVRKASLKRLAEGKIELSALLPEAHFPIILRPYGTHAGEGMEKIDDPEGVGDYLGNQDGQTFYIAPFIDYAGPDGFFRKQRIAVIDGRPFPGHWATSRNWMVHYLNSGMLENSVWRGEEAAWMRDFHKDFAIRHAEAFKVLHRKLGLDYFLIDCGEMPDGRLLLFEAQVAMIVHAMDPVDIFPYKRPAMQKLFKAFQNALQSRCWSSPHDKH